jgi:hypothetical protein
MDVISKNFKLDSGGRPVFLDAVARRSTTFPVTNEILVLELTDSAHPMKSVLKRPTILPFRSEQSTSYFLQYLTSLI